MASGRQVLQSLDQSLDAVRRDYRRLDTELQRVTTDLGRQRRQEAAIYSKLARLRLDAIAANQLGQRFDTADRQAGELLEARDRRLDELTAELDQFEQDIEQARAAREQLGSKLDAVEQELQAILESADAQLAQDTAYSAAKSEAQSLLDQAAHAAEKAVQSESTRREKGAPYDSDALFSYLWSRGYGTSSYRAWPLARLMDRMVARHIRYEEARRNYWMLNEIPRRLRSHSAKLQTEAESALGQVAELERAADIAAGAEQPETQIAELEASIEQADNQLNEIEGRFEAALQERERFASGSDRFFTQAMQLLVENFRSEPVAEIRRDAALTAHHQDDALAVDLAGIREAVGQLTQQLEDQQSAHTRHLARLRELTTVRQRFKQRGFDSYDSVINDLSSVGLMLGEFMRGLIGSDDLWRVIRNSQRFKRKLGRTTPRRGGRINMPRIPRGIRVPRGMGGGGGFKAPKMPRGGFRTKGGF